MLWEPFRLERRRLPGPERGRPSGEGLDYCAVRERGVVPGPTSLVVKSGGEFGRVELVAPWSVMPSAAERARPDRSPVC